MELSSGFLSFPPDDWLRLVERVHSYGLKAKPELGIQFGAGGDTETSALEDIGTSDCSKIVNLWKQFIDAGVERMMIESGGHHRKCEEMADRCHPIHVGGLADGKGHVRSC